MFERSLILPLALWSGLAAAEPASPRAEPQVETAESPAPPPPYAARQRDALPVAAAALPGLVVHGSGHFAAGEAATARKLLLMEGIGFGMFLAGGLTIVFTGASRYVVGPAASVTMTGFGLFSTSYLADLYGTVSLDGGAALSRYRAPARWETELGYRRLSDSQFAHEDFVVERVSRQIGAFRVSPSGWFSTRGDTARYRFEAQYRLFGAVEEPVSDASFVDLTTGFVHQRHRPEHFSKSHAELSVDTRYDLARLGPTLRGSFIELGAGYALGRIDYDLAGLAVPHDLEHLLLGRFGFGVMLRGLSAPGSEVLVYYDHRHDDYVAGLKVTGLGSGVIGHFGVAGRWFLTDAIGAAVDAQVGSAYLAGFSLLFRSTTSSKKSWKGVRP
jgi:hypothetical protein